MTAAFGIYNAHFQVLTAAILDCNAPLVIVYKIISKCRKVYVIYKMYMYMASPYNLIKGDNSNKN